MMRIIIIGASLLLLGSCVKENTKTLEFKERNESSLLESGGKAYQNTVSREFLTQPNFMRECIPHGSPLQEGFTIYFEVLKTGGLGELYFTKRSKVTECVARKVKGKVFSKPKNTFVARIKLNFKK